MTVLSKSGIVYIYLMPDMICVVWLQRDTLEREESALASLKVMNMINECHVD